MEEILIAKGMSIAIPAYRNAPRLRRCLSSLGRFNPELLRVTTVVDDSGDGCVAKELVQEFSEVRWIVNKENLGFASSANAAVLACENDWVLLLNDDVELVESIGTELVRQLGDESLFALSLQSINENGQFREGAKRLVWRMGIARILHNPADQSETINGFTPSAYAVGGHAMFRRKVFEELGGFDLSFDPFYWEDVDLCARAARDGYHTKCYEMAHVLHRNDGAIKSANDRDRIRYYTWLNRLRFSALHAKEIQRIMLPFGIAWQALHAKATSDYAKWNAVKTFLRLSGRQRH